MMFANDELVQEALLEVPTPEELINEYPLSLQDRNFIHHSRESVRAILEGGDRRLLLIVGPCSIHDLDSALEYAHRLSRLSHRVSDHLFIIMRAYVEKPRTITGWKGLLYDPDLDGSYNLGKGMRSSRQLFAELTRLRVPIGCELLEMVTAPYFADFLTWGCIGARTATSSPHRALAASLPFSVGFKNTTDGNVENAIHGMVAAQRPHVCFGISSNGRLNRLEAAGNGYCHLVLRGGHRGPNYMASKIHEATMACRRAQVSERLLVDCAHDNCEKSYEKQILAFQTVLDQIKCGNQNIVGMMVESHLYAGAQAITPTLRYGVSITDPCLDWETTERLIWNSWEAKNSSPQES